MSIAFLGPSETRLPSTIEGKSTPSSPRRVSALKLNTW